MPKVLQLEADLKAKTAEIEALITSQMQAAEKEERERTKEERAAVEEKMVTARDLKARIERSKADDAMLAEISRLTDGMSQQDTAARDNGDRTRKSRGMVSLGQQWLDSEANVWIQKTKGARSASFNSPSVELYATLLDESSGSGGPLLVTDYQPGIVDLRFKRLVVADLIAPGSTDGISISYFKETTFTNAAATVAEGGTKPESTLVFALVTDTVRKIATWIPVTSEMLEDAAQIRSYIDARLRLGVMLAEEDQLLNGDGTPPNIQGIMNRSNLATAVARGADTNADAIFKQMTAIATTAFVDPTGVVINPTNWQTIALAKDANGQYYGAGPFAPRQLVRTIWGVPAVVTPSIVANTALVGDYAGSAQVFRKGGIRVEASNSHSTFFVENKVAILAEERAALAVYRPGAFGKVTGLN